MKRRIIIPVVLITVALIGMSYLTFTLSKYFLADQEALLLGETIDMDELEGLTEDVDDRLDQKEEPRSPSYRIDLQFDPQQRLLSGTSHISVWNRAEQPTDHVLIHAFMNAFQKELALPVLEGFKDKAYPEGIKYTNINFHRVEVNNASVEHELDGTVLRLDLEELWSPGQKIEITLQWETVIPEIHHRVGTYQDAFWFGNVLPIMAVYDNEWHAYQYKTIGDPFFSEAADYSVTVQVPEEYEVITSGNELDSDIEEDYKMTRVVATQIRDFAFAITSNHKVVTAETKSGKKVHLYYRYAEEAIVLRNLELSVDMLDYLEERVGPYPYEQLHIFENNMFITGMEYPGLVFVSAHRLNTTTGHVTVLHEIVHQWFYNLIGNDQILEPWLDEGFATYFADEFLQGDQLDQYYTAEQELLEHRAPDLRIQDVDHYGDWSSYWSSNYRKSSFLIFDLRKRMGEEKFQAFIKEYYAQYQFKIATTEGFMRLVEKYLEEDIDSFFEEWGLSFIPR